MPHPKPVFGISNKRVGMVVFLDDGTVIGLVDGAWVESEPLPRTARAVALDAVLPTPTEAVA